MVTILGGCAQTTRSEDLADTVLRAIEADKPAVAGDYFDADTRSLMTPASVHELSRVMHAFGHYRYVSQTSALDERRYDLEAQFDVGSMLVQMRLDPDGKIAALHVVPNVPLKTATTGK
jgi:hypothetical protein